MNFRYNPFSKFNVENKKQTGKLIEKMSLINK